MGAAAKVGGTALSLASLGLNYQGDVTKAEGDAAGTEYKADIAARNAQYGRVQATEVGGQLAERLNATLGHIDTIRAAAHADPTSPTGAAVRDRAEYLGDRDMNIRVNTINRQAQENEDNASYLRQAGAFALSQGKNAALAKLLGGIGQGITNLSGGGGGGDKSSDSLGFAMPNVRD